MEKITQNYIVGISLWIYGLNCTLCSRYTIENLNNIPDYDNVNILCETQKITGDVITRMFFGGNFSQLKINDQPISIALAKIIEDLAKLTKSTKSLLIGIIIKNNKITKSDKSQDQRIKQFRELALKTIQERRQNLEGTYDQNPDRKDLLQILLESEQNNQLTEDEIIGNFISFLFAGMDTTSHAVTSLLWFLSKNQEFLYQVNNEINYYIQNEKLVNLETLPKLNILEACIKETLRIMSPALRTSMRQANQDVFLGDYIIKKGTLIHADLQSSHYGKGLINEDQFNPERQLNNVIEKIDQFYRIPFSAGPRNCIGQHLSLIELKIITIVFLKKFTYQIVSPQDFKLTLRPLLEFKQPFIAKLQLKTI